MVWKSINCRSMSFVEGEDSWVRSIMRVRGYVISVERYAMRSQLGIWGKAHPGMAGSEDTVIVFGNWKAKRIRITVSRQSSNCGKEREKSHPSVRSDMYMSGLIVVSLSCMTTTTCPLTLSMIRYPGFRPSWDEGN